jgi:flagellar biosynthesis/type III secretory pathway M-ring protein FliF/YscJ
MERGDQLIVEALPFESTVRRVQPPVTVAPETGRPGVPGTNTGRRLTLPNLTRQQWIYVGGATGALVVLISVGVFFFLKKRKKKRVVKTTVDGAKAVSPAAHRDPDDPSSLEDTIGNQLAEQAALKKKQEQELLMGLKLPGATTSKAEVLVKRLAEEAKRDPAAFAQVVRTWMADNDV